MSKTTNGCKIFAIALLIVFSILLIRLYYVGKELNDFRSTHICVKEGELPECKLESTCPSDMVTVSKPNGSDFCIDKYEASDSGITVPVDFNSDGDTKDGVLLGVQYVCEDGFPKGREDGSSALNCLGFNMAQSKYNQDPRIWVTQTEAKASCIAAGKRLCTAYEWFLAAQGTPDYDIVDPNDDSEECNIWDNSKPKEAVYSLLSDPMKPTKTGTASRCISDFGAYDMVGNLWEWVSDTAYWNKDYPVKEEGAWPLTFAGSVYYKGKEILGDKYIAVVDEFGIPNKFSDNGVIAFNYDYIWHGREDGAYGFSDIFDVRYGQGRPISGISRGGDLNFNQWAGIYAIVFDSAPSQPGRHSGFRCCRSFLK